MESYAWIISDKILFWHLYNHVTNILTFVWTCHKCLHHACDFGDWHQIIYVHNTLVWHRTFVQSVTSCTCWACISGLFTNFPNKEWVHIYLGQDEGAHVNDYGDHMNINEQKRWVITIHADSTLITMRVMKTTKVTITIIMCQTFDTNKNVNRTHIELKIIRVVTSQPNNNTATYYWRGNQQNWFQFNWNILCWFILWFIKLKLNACTYHYKHWKVHKKFALQLGNLWKRIIKYGIIFKTRYS